MKIACVVGARPNFMKIAPILEAMKKYPQVQPILVHTGQHYDYEMSGVFFEDLDIPEPDVHLGVGSGSHAVQTAKIMIEFEKVVLEHQPDLVLVVGDVNSTLACALVAAKENIPVAHVEAGIRSFDRSMPEEMNRLLTDAISDYLFVPTEHGCANLSREGIPEEKIFLVGDVMIDTLLQYKDKAATIPILDNLGLQKGNYALMTMHRPHNVDIKENLIKILNAIQEIQSKISVVFPMHPRTRHRIEKFQLNEQLSNMKNLIVLEPIGYLRFLNLMMNSKFVLTDSGGMQEETTVLNIPCLTLRENTERPETIDGGTNTLVGNDTQRIISESLKILNGKGK
ncbi:UDP-N-acetylglucosamine 2-epimerase (non-hydrolyzing), partial [Candidatus Poribacteria bacterium]|nr:UDP-N-acetylglucosamine 2-epimerase (non-hydrolyzing) [Candidatus Poribacteria bacterium]